MTPEQLEAHRARFEQRFYAEFGLEPLRSGPGYVEAAASDAWQAYQWALDDVDRAQHAAPGVKPRLIGWRTSDFLMETADKAKAENWQVHHEIQPIFEGDPHTSLKPPEVQAAPYAQLSDQSVVMVVAFDEGVKEPRIVSWNKFTVGKHRLYAAQPPQQSAQPVAYRAWFDEDHGARWLFTLWPDEERLEVDWQPLYAAAQPVAVQPVEPTQEQIARSKAASGSEQTPFEAGCEVLQYLKEQGAAYYYTHRMLTCLHDKNEDEPKYRAEREQLIAQLRKKCAALEAELAQPVEVQPLTNAQVSEGQDSNGLFPGSVASCAFTMGVRFAESKHGIKPTSSEGGA